MSDFMMRTGNFTGAALRRRFRTASLLVAAPLALSGCGDLFNVDNPVDILAEDLEDVRTIPALSNSAEAAVVGIYDSSIQYSELVGDGAIHVATNQGNLALDLGILGEFNERAEDLYNSLAAARWAATEVTERLEALVKDPATDPAVARSYYWDAVARITLADLFEEVPFDGGPPQTPAQVYETTVPLLETAGTIASAAGLTEYVAASHGTLARLYRSLYFEQGGNNLATFQLAAEAAQRALATDADYRINARYALPGSSNGLTGAWDIGVFYDVMDPKYANRVDPVSGERDPRISHAPWSGLISTFGDSIFQQTKYPVTQRSAPIRVSSWQEATLILAEYELLTGDLATAVSYINDVRAAAGLPAFSASTAAEVREQLLYERSTEFWLEGRRWQDMRYYDIVPPRWNPAQKQAGVDRRFPVSLRERSTNTHYTGG